MKIINAVFVTIIVVACLLVWMAISRAGSGFQTNSFVAMFERREGIYPGGTKVLPECSCTVKYLGTRISGNLYTVYLEKLD